MSIRKIILLFSFIVIPILTDAQHQDESILHTQTSLSSGSYTLQSLLDKLNTIPPISIVYNGKELPLESEVTLDQANLTLGEVLNLLIEKLPLQYQLKNTYIILKSKKPESKFVLQGTVTDSETGESLIGVNIYISKDFISCVTDVNGQYTLKIPHGEYLLSISYVGYVRKQIALSLNSDQNLDILLDPLKIMMDEVNITSQKQFFGNMNIGRSIASIDVEEIQNLNVNNVADILHAREAGVWTTKTSGAPGDHQRIRIRGIHSIYSGVDPLYVVDGITVPNVNLSTLGVDEINIHDIKNITILKDISSSAIYGFQGGNGVVLIDTKQGDGDAIHFTTRIGVQRFDNFYPLLDTKDYLETLDSFSSVFSHPLNRYYPKYSDTLSNVDWQDEIFQDAMLKEYLLSLTGSFGKLKYYISGGYFDQTGILKGSMYTKYTLLANVSRTFYKRFNIGLNYRAGLQLNQNNLDSYMGNTQIIESITKSPCFRSTADSFYYNSSGGRSYRTIYGYQGLYGRTDPDSLFQLNSKSLDVLSHAVAGSLKMQITDNLFLDAAASLSFRKNRFRSRSYYSWSNDTSAYMSNKDIYLSENYKIQLYYSKRFKSHELNFIGGYHRYKDRAAWEIDSTDKDFSLGNSTNELFIRNSLARYGNYGDVTRVIGSWSGHINYTYKSKYSLSIASSYDHLSDGMYLDERRLFPSVAVNWDIAQEPIINNIEWIDQFNVNVNWGKAGYFPINTISDEQYISTQYNYGGHIGQGLSPVVLSNQYIKPESIKEINFGTHISLLNSRINLSANYFRRINNDLIVQSQLSILYGEGLAFINIGEMKGSGKEYGIELIPILKSGFTWYSRFGFSQFNEKITQLNNEGEIRFVDSDFLIPDIILEEGGDLGNIYGYEYVGRWTKEDEIEQPSDYFNSYGLKFRKNDTLSSGITSDDKTLIGNSIPDYTLSWYNSFSMKRFSVDLLWYAVKGISKYNATRAATFMGANNAEIIPLIEDSIGAIRHNIIYESSYFVEDASFIRLKYVTFTYHPKKLLWNKVEYSLSLSLENMLTFTSYKGYDPEATIYTGNNFTDNAIDRGAYPTSKAMYFSISLKF